MTADPSPSRPIVVAIDGSDSSIAALRWASRQAELTHSPLRAVYAWQVPQAYGYVPAIEPLTWDGIARSTLEEAIGKGLGADAAARVERLIVRGHPAQVLMDAAGDADLIVVGSRGRGGFAGLLLGSVSQYVVTHARCPVVVVRDAD
ncbi:MAG TPA: universal stress protein [Pseudonocardia sp.]|jgi:nucleotide-binding universal stress UspA family protein|nr:universal stress protein [Pseudonocardia sp.]